MSTSSTIFRDALIPVFFVLGLGYYAGWRGRVDNRNVSALNTTLMHFVLPCSLFLAVGRTSPAVLRSQLSLLAVIAVAMISVYLLVFFLENRLFHHAASEASVQALTVSFSNNVAVGLPLVSSLFAVTGQLAVAAAIIAGALVVSPITLVVLECYATGERGTQSLSGRLGPAMLTS